jgi:hypothetical protein
MAATSPWQEIHEKLVPVVMLGLVSDAGFNGSPLVPLPEYLTQLLSHLGSPITQPT